VSGLVGGSEQGRNLLWCGADGELVGERIRRLGVNQVVVGCLERGGKGLVWKR
jgi:hypothetical protein